MAKLSDRAAHRNADRLTQSSKSKSLLSDVFWPQLYNVNCKELRIHLLGLQKIITVYRICNVKFEMKGIIQLAWFVRVSDTLTEQSKSGSLFEASFQPGNDWQGQDWLLADHDNSIWSTCSSKFSVKSLKTRTRVYLSLARAEVQRSWRLCSELSKPQRRAEYEIQPTHGNGVNCRYHRLGILYRTTFTN